MSKTKNIEILYDRRRRIIRMERAKRNQTRRHFDRKRSLLYETNNRFQGVNVVIKFARVRITARGDFFFPFALFSSFFTSYTRCELLAAVVRVQTPTGKTNLV